MKIYCTGWWNAEIVDFDRSYDCIDGDYIKSYEDARNNPEIGEISPAQKTIDGEILLPIMCTHCLDDEASS